MYGTGWTALQPTRIPHISHHCEDKLRLSSCDLSAVSGVCFTIRAASIFHAVGAYLTLSSLLLKQCSQQTLRQWLGAIRFSMSWSANIFGFNRP